MPSSLISASRLWVLLTALSSVVSVVSSLECIVPASGTNATDDAPAIFQAFEECGQGGVITFSKDTTYYVNSVLNVTAKDAVIDIRGTLLVSDLLCQDVWTEPFN